MDKVDHYYRGQSDRHNTFRVNPCIERGGSLGHGCWRRSNGETCDQMNTLR